MVVEKCNEFDVCTVVSDVAAQVIMAKAKKAEAKAEAPAAAAGKNQTGIFM